MNGDALVAHALRVAQEYPFAEHCWPFGPEYDVFKVDGKIFMIAMSLRGRPLISLKADPALSLLHQAIYPSVQPGYHLNKKHWISVYGGDDIQPDLLESLIDASWHLVVDKLPKSRQKRLRPA
ncbi:MmcQ/YjbR family DNA-binding protein [Pluralibacter sp.]|uniref:MmcQ/YjbR family DNA-binding protein n=1 Tax=Pluralibacter sp. TaxID=1920032 RepID=UPI0025DE1EED|nr:MmcQ/YjbR family DNA-binding protein [Pluralibacter sp.]MBV8044800.1 MmcQ/YjbR family DNA-binding protein [Pluralibacter sp.]